MKLKCLAATLLLLTCVALGQVGHTSTKVTMVLVNGPKLGWAEPGFDAKLERMIGGRPGMELVSPLEARELSEELEGRFSSKELVDWGLHTDCRYIIWCDIVHEDLQVERGFKFPFIVNQKRVAARLEIEYRLVDCFRGRLLLSDKIKRKSYGPSSMEFIDDSGADPDLYFSYLEKKRLFDEMETSAASEVFAELEKVARQR